MDKKFLVAVTACPTGIAHTFMAESALRKAADSLGVEIRVETDGASGVGSPLTEEEIARCHAVIIAADKVVDLERFKGKPMLKVSVGDGVRKAKELIEVALNTSLPIYGYEDVAKSIPVESKEKPILSNAKIQFDAKNIGSYLYRVLMSGVSNMLPFVVVGGVLVAISFLFGINSSSPQDPTFNIWAAKIKYIGGTALSFMVVIFSGFIAQAIAGRNGFVAGMVGGAVASAVGAGFLGGVISGFLAGFLILGLIKATIKLPKSLEGLKSIFILPLLGSIVVGLIMISLGEPLSNVNKSLMATLSGFNQSNPVLLGLIIGSMMAFDMGGPVNKAAYVTGTMLLGSENYTFMAGVMAAGMTPPLVTALATTIFAKHFDEEERTNGMVNYIMSATFISEGAIPFAARNPLIVIPIFMLSSSISAILTYLFKVAVKAPHGGLLILPLTTNALQWVLSILIGSLVGAVIFGFLKKAKKI